MSRIVYDDIEHYIDRTYKKNEPFLADLRAFAEENHIYIMKPQVEQLLRTILCAVRPKRILEVGTAIGYSALVFSACLPGAHITTIERDEDVLVLAKENIKKREAQNKIYTIFGDADEVIESLNGSYDFVFLDAAKGQYQKHFDLCLERVAPGGMIVTDDVLYMGMTASDKLATKKHITIARRLRAFLDYLCTDERFETAILPVGDGVAVTYIKK